MQNFQQELEKIMEDMQPPNILVIGRTGAGKSSLINSVFGKKLAQTGTGLPVSSAFIRYPDSTKEKSPVVVYDSAGYEMGKEDKFKQDVFKFLDDTKQSEIHEQIHLVWYVVHAGLKRFEHFDAEIIAHLKEVKAPTIIVLSQADLARENEMSKIEETIENYQTSHKFGHIDIIRIASDPIKDKPFGVEKLVDKSVSLLPELYSEAFVARQIASLGAKKKTALNYIKVAAGAAFASGYIPIPATTAAAIVTSQTTLLAKISFLYGYSEWNDIINEVGQFTVASVLTSVTTTLLDVFSMMFLPGTFITGTLSGGAAATYIVIIGLTYRSVFHKLSQEELSGKGKTEIKEFIKKTFEKEFKKYSSDINIKSKKDLDSLDKFD